MSAPVNETQPKPQAQMTFQQPEESPAASTEQNASKQQEDVEAQKKPSLWMRGGGALGDCLDAIICFEACKCCADICCC